MDFSTTPLMAIPIWQKWWKARVGIGSSPCPTPQNRFRRLRIFPVLHPAGKVCRIAGNTDGIIAFGMTHACYAACMTD